MIFLYLINKTKYFRLTDEIRELKDMRQSKRRRLRASTEIVTI